MMYGKLYNMYDIFIKTSSVLNRLADIKKGSTEFEGEKASTAEESQISGSARRFCQGHLPLVAEVRGQIDRGHPSTTDLPLDPYRLVVTSMARLTWPVPARGGRSGPGSAAVIRVARYCRPRGPYGTTRPRDGVLT